MKYRLVHTPLLTPHSIGKRGAPDSIHCEKVLLSGEFLSHPIFLYPLAIKVEFGPFVDTNKFHFLYEVDKPQAVSRLLKIRCKTRERGIVVPSWLILSARMRR